MPNRIYLTKYSLSYTQTDNYARQFSIWGCKTRENCELIDQRSGIIDWNGVKEFTFLPQNTYQIFKLVIEKIKADSAAAAEKEAYAQVKEWLLYGFDAPVSRTLENGWLCIMQDTNWFALVRRNAADDIECLSDITTNCKWFHKAEECKTVAATDPAKITPFGCGEMHTAVYKSTGYEGLDGKFFPFHWCNIGRSQLFPEGTGQYNRFFSS